MPNSRGQTRDGTRSEKTIQVDDAGRPTIVAGRTIPVETQREPFADGSVGQTRAIAATAAIYPLPEPGGLYRVTAIGGTVYLRWDGGTATTSVKGFTVPIGSGGWMEIRFPADSVSFIGTATAGSVTFLHLKR